MPTTSVIKKKKRILYEKQACQCCYCEKIFLFKDLTLEHLTRRCEGGTYRWGNIALACAPCNHHRGRNDWLTWKSFILGEIDVSELYSAAA